MKKIEVSEAALDTLQRMVEELQAERDSLLAVLVDVRDNSKEDSPEMWKRIDDAIDSAMKNG